jgi:hypothetical protein
MSSAFADVEGGENALIDAIGGEVQAEHAARLLWTTSKNREPRENKRNLTVKKRANSCRT